MVQSNRPIDLLKGRVLASVFYEASTRTSCSFIAAMERLGGSVIALHDMGNTSVKKGESLSDTIRTMESICDITVLRHPGKGKVQEAAGACRKPIISGGDGTGEHPTQALLDAFTIREELGTLNGITITMVGDLKHGRTVHSLAQLVSLYDVKLVYVSPEELRMPAEVKQAVKEVGVEQTEHTALTDDIVRATDILYVTRVQKERFASEEAYEAVKGSYTVDAKTLSKAKKHMAVMHPLPRVDELSEDVDSDPRAAYFRQMTNGMYVRMALLAVLLQR
jgi:carbamoyl-phosphate synthase/aspartate carbamoyltransferase/dihydroorotase